ncbi:putative Fe-S cluster assembly protein SufT [Colwellia sp. MB3u-70]|uniref:putative Fe-S cluster assembly protein SufT n=1 Tax=unclassified Colwellia TaxID=196834 RepID=UPI0015F42AB3|nr:MULTISPECIES: putative Fe-S cluster assembly protein SufT [unclassified Colwellia]MBA6293550.1 putative Fe-S cluster assembly protein SufT [Colwellia sp. MB3u-8]MBA6306050.1 putative Fe-S cluster assembly protein SufT [Colwellia sp. MB3u-70]
MQQKIVVTERECKARGVPNGDLQVIPQGEFVNITQDLGGNYTVTWRGNMLRIDGTDADAIGRKSQKLDFPILNDGLIHKDHVLQALATVYDPEIPIDLLSLGLIYKVSINQDTQTVHIDMTLTAPACGMGPVLVGDVEYRVSMVPNVKKVAVELIFDPPWSREMMSEEAQLEAGIFF